MTLEDQYGLLPAQAGLVYNSLRGPAAGVDVVQVVIGADETPDRTAWEAAWRRTVARHAVLRTSFRFRSSGEPLQEVYRDVDLEFDWIDAPGDPDEVLRAYLKADRERSFDMSGMLCRAVILVHAPARFTFVITFHHAILDGRSLQVLAAELFSDYAATRRGETVEFPVPRPYRDFVAWWQKLDLGPAKAFWSDFLAGYTAPASMPGVIPEPESTVDLRRRSADPATYEITLDEAAGARLREAAARAGVTVATLVNAAWAVVLGRYRSTDDVLFAVTRSCRHGTVEGAESMVGLLINSIPLRVSVAPETTVGDLLRDVSRRAAGVRDHQLAPLGDIQRWGGISDAGPDTLVVFERKLLRSALTKVDDRFADRPVAVHRQPSFLATLYVFDEPAPRVMVIYDRGRFRDDAAERAARHVVRVLAAFAGDHDRRLADVDLGDDDERALVLTAWNDTAFPYPRNASIPEVFAAQVAARPDAPALANGSTELTYAQLDARANQLAHLLRGHAVGLETPVAIALPRSAELVVAMLAVMKAGGTYVPLDTANPPARNTLVLTDCGARIVITTTALAGTLPAEVELPLDALTAELAAQPTTAPPCPAFGDSLAYLCYTSGSTGVPKGAAVPHRGVLRLVHDPGYVTLGPGETLLQLCAVAFDVSVFELWGSLLTGARLVVAPPGPLSLPQIAEVLRDSAVSTLWLTAGLFHQIVELDVRSLAGVGQLLAGGDVLAPGAVRAAIRARGGRPFINGYGPTENTTFTACHVMTDPDEVGDRVPIGRPIPQSTTYVLDEDLRPCPIGVPGELFTGGDGVARGYVGRPALTADKFVPDPFGTAPGGRLYRTGDLARWRADGVLEFLGRLDGQVKIRGFRIEPGEVETVLCGHRSVAEAVVVPRGEGEAKHLVAYVTVSGAAAADRATVGPALREHAARHLPDYLVPATVVVLDRLPLNVSGKVDRRALPDPEPAASTVDTVAAGSPATEPGSAVEVRLAQIWRDILRVDHVGRDDDFFAMGGNSLAATRLIFRVRDAFGVDIPVLTLYQAATLTACAAAIEALLPEPFSAGPDETAASVRPAGGGIVARDRAAFRSGGPAPVAASAPVAAAAPVTAPAPPAASPSPPAALSGGALGGGSSGGGSSGGGSSGGGIVRRDRSAFRAGPAPAPQSTVEPAASTVDTATRPPHLWPLATDDWGVWRWVCLRSAGFPFALHEAVASPELAATADAFNADETEEGRSAYVEEFARAERVLSRALHAVAADSRFREAVAWQNRHALATGVDALLRRDPETVARTGRYRKYEALVASYLQRYCAKNDTIGFFGPVGWAEIREGARAIELDPAPGGTLAARKVYFEGWAVRALAEAYSEGMRPWLVPRRMPFVDVVGPPDDARLQMPFAPAAPLTPTEAHVFALVDGVRTAAEVVAAALATPGSGVRDADDVMRALAHLNAQHSVAWMLDVAPNDIYAEKTVRARFTSVADPALRDPALAALDDLEAARDRVAAINSSEDPEGLVTALESMEATFTRLTGEAPTRRAGEVYAGRTLVFEECLRIDDLTFGPDLLAPLAEPLELILEAARWYTAAGAALFHRACLAAYRERARVSGRSLVPFAEFWLDANDLIFDGPGLSVGPIQRAVQERWASVLQVPQGQRRVQLRSADLRERVKATFSVAQPGWAAAVQHSPDLMIAAASAEAIRSGDFLWVLGELHPGLNTVRYATWLAYHPAPDKMRRAMREDLGRPVTLLAPTGAQGGTPARLSNVLHGPDDTQLVFAPDSCGYDPKYALFVGECDLEEVDGRLVVRSRRGGPPRDLVEVLADPLSMNLSQFFRIVPSAAYTPRVTIDQLVIQRESWKFPAGELGFAEVVDESRRFLLARRWVSAHDLPRHVFMRAQGELKPIFVDLASLASIDLLSRAVRRARRHAGDGATIGVTEMLPSPDQLWLVDAEGRRYTSELRICAVDRRRG